MNFKEDFVNALLLHLKIWGRISYHALTGAGMGVGIVFASLVFGLSRNPSEEARLFKYAMLGFALTEAVGLLGLMMAFLLLFS